MKKKRKEEGQNLPSKGLCVTCQIWIPKLHRTQMKTGCSWSFLSSTERIQSITATKEVTPSPLKKLFLSFPL